jgi:Zn-dependent peptidase ImmA (M78 family)
LTTTINNTSAPRYDLIHGSAWSLLCESNISIFPIDPNHLIKIHGWGLRTVGELAEKFEYIRSEVICGQDAEVRYKVKTQKYCIIFNEKAHEGRIQYSLCHEIGHIILGHSKELCNIKMSGHDIPDALYDFFELEAEIFASEVLMPTPILLELNLFKPPEIRRYCGVSKKASETKANFLKRNYINYPYKKDIPMANKVKKQFQDFISLYQKQYHLFNE